MSWLVTQVCSQVISHLSCVSRKRLGKWAYAMDEQIHTCARQHGSTGKCGMDMKKTTHPSATKIYTTYITDVVLGPNRKGFATNDPE